MTSKTLSVVTPVYFNAGSLPRLFEEFGKLEDQLAGRGVALELIFVDDGSKDRSLELLLEFRQRRPATKVVKLTRNFGAVHCSKTGFRFVTGDAFMIVAADLQDPPSLIVDMVERWEQGAKFVICERSTREDPLVSRIYSRIYYKLLRALVIRDYPQGGYDMALMDRALLEPMTHSAKSVFTPLLAYWLGYTPEVIKYHRPKREHGKSGWTFRKKLTAFLDVMLGFSITPIRLISAVGAFTALFSFLYGGAVVINALLNRIPVEGFATVVALITFLLGLIILMLGVIGEYLWRIFEETNKRPETVIEQVW
ncbi:MAG TPA: glycosyltransferase family 2 protein [Ramlibacter sp.]|jgi:dolichol-phosphate mannosyltransferase|uniref:glycosyltransferase family 2 protein n=1 Tax=Ramlibacter sp. TaxID=1917967 RepID=UPI002D4CE395|nr:glycosyltransferase family 2 protein [Ramlibacter sp.]HZY20074.1 glycosyltransferase family 2 protein [Ramlibacter sp.]